MVLLRCGWGPFGLELVVVVVRERGAGVGSRVPANTKSARMKLCVIDWLFV